MNSSEIAASVKLGSSRDIDVERAYTMAVQKAREWALQREAMREGRKLDLKAQQYIHKYLV